MGRDELARRFLAACDGFTGDEPLVILRIAEDAAARLRIGAPLYGPLNLHQPRPWQRMRREETQDEIIYDTCEELAEEHARASTLPAPPPDSAPTEPGRGI